LDDLHWFYAGPRRLAQKELGYDPRIADTFCSFKELLFFFERVKEIVRTNDPERPMPLLFYSNWHNCFRISNRALTME